MRSLAVARPANCGVLLIRQLKVQAASPLADRVLQHVPRFKV
jgi:hypothetical protein